MKKILFAVIISLFVMCGCVTKTATYYVPQGDSPFVTPPVQKEEPTPSICPAPCHSNHDSGKEAVEARKHLRKTGTVETGRIYGLGCSVSGSRESWDCPE